MTDVLAHADAKVVAPRDRGGRLPRAASTAARDLVALRAAPAPPADPSLRARVDQLTGRLLALRAGAAAGHDWQSLEPLGALLEDVRAAGYDPLLAETLLVDARIRSPFEPEGAVPLYEEAYRRAAALHLDDFAAEAAIQLTAIVGTFQHKFAEGDRWAGLAEVALGHAAEHERLRGWFFNVRGALEAGEGEWRRADDRLRRLGVGPRAGARPGAPRPGRRAGEPLKGRVDARRAPTRRWRPPAARTRLAAAVFPADAYEVNAALLARAHALVALKRAAEARADVTAVEAAFEKTLGRDHPFLADPMTVLGEVALLEGRPLDARGVLERAWEIRSTHVTDARRARGDRLRAGARHLGFSPRPIARTRWSWPTRRATATRRSPISPPGWPSSSSGSTRAPTRRHAHGRRAGVLKRRYALRRAPALRRRSA